MHLMMLSYNKFPDGDAGAVREYSLAKLIKSLDNEVTIVGMGASDPYILNEYNSIPYYSLRLKGSDYKTKLKNYFGYLNRLRILLDKYEGNLDIILVVDIPIDALIMVKRIAKDKGIKLLHDSVEWYSPEQFKLKWFSPAYIFKNLYNKLLIDKNFSVIAISKYLENHFSNKGIKTTRIPVVFDLNEMRINDNINDKLVIIYAGSPGKKDHLNVILKGISELSIEKINQIEFRIFGVNEIEIKILCKNDLIDYEKIQSSLKIYGKVARTTVLEYLNTSDFSVMLRDSSSRYAKAGFPTKIVESLTCGTPVITNISSDLNEYLIDSNNCIIVEQCNSTSFSKAIERALSLNIEVIKKMKFCAHDTALQNFDFHLYKNEIKTLLNDYKITNK